MPNPKADKELEGFAAYVTAEQGKIVTALRLELQSCQAEEARLSSELATITARKAVVQNALNQQQASINALNGGAA